MLSENIKKYRQAKNLSQDDLANRIFVVRQTLSKWENNRSVPDADQLIKLAKELDVSVNDLLGVQIADDSNLEDVATELAKANEKIAKFSEEKRLRTKIGKIRGVIIGLSLLAIAVMHFTGNKVVSISISAILLLAVMFIFYRNLNLLSLGFAGEGNTKIYKLVTIVNTILIASVFLFIVLMEMGVLQVTKLQERWIATISTSILLLFTGIVAPKLPHNRHTGLRLPWTITNEKAWNIAHKILGIISIPLGLVYVFLGFQVADISRLTLVVLVIWIGLPSIISLFYALRYNRQGENGF